MVVSTTFWQKLRWEIRPLGRFVWGAECVLKNTGHWLLPHHEWYPRLLVGGLSFAAITAIHKWLEDDRRMWNSSVLWPSGLLWVWICLGPVPVPLPDTRATLTLASSAAHLTLCQRVTNKGRYVRTAVNSCVPWDFSLEQMVRLTQHRRISLPQWQQRSHAQFWLLPKMLPLPTTIIRWS